MKILVLNSGSSTIKYKLFDKETDYRLLTNGSAERIGLDKGRVRYLAHGQQVKEIVTVFPDHRAALQIIFDILRDNVGTGSQRLEVDVDAIGHRVVHGGSEFLNSILVDDNVVKSIEKNARFAPLHNPANVVGIALCKELLPGIPNVAVFDTTLHQTIPAKAFLYGLPLELYNEHGIRKYGFQGISHGYVAEKAANAIARPLDSLKLVTCHLGNGCSITAFDGAKSIDTSMGLTPLEGVIMATRSGDIDPAVTLYLMKELGLSLEDVQKLLNKKSGLLGLCGKSDMRDILELVNSGNEQAQTALEMFTYRIQKYIGAYVAALNGVDAIIFTAGIGENSPDVRARILENFGYLGVRVDQNKNKENATIFSKSNSNVYTMTIPTDEELVIARETYRIIARAKR